MCPKNALIELPQVGVLPKARLAQRLVVFVAFCSAC